ncbi:NAD(P)-binding domain-containing protein [Nocardia brasiliensis]|uniref:NAD(P)-binding domain-containing protein n=1 Tax=Nocardia brasiliensis TaxID=37326 RepID=UPI002453B2FB|nr:NAD(P)-binding domain-containing protein [Nocardia brasiliensis]
MTSEKRTRITVLGLGRMGSAIAGRYLAAGYPTTVWNRTPGRAPQLGALGARPAATHADAIAARELIIVTHVDTPRVGARLGARGGGRARGAAPPPAAPQHSPTRSRRAN